MFLINGYFRNQPITGQQRFAHEIADRLRLLLPNSRELVAPRTGLKAWEWGHMQATVPVRARNSLLISLTARAPLLVSHDVVTIHDLFPLTHPQWFSRKYLALHRPLLRAHLKHASGFVVVSEPVREELRQHLGREAPIVVAPNAPSAQFAASVVDEWRRPADLPPRYFLTVGSIEPRKNLGRLLRAYSSLPEGTRRSCPLLVIGESSAVFRAGMPDQEVDGVAFLGRVTDNELVSLYAGASAYVSTSLAEGFGLPLVEAAAVMRGVMVLSDIAVYRWVAQGCASTFVDPTNVESIREGLLSALEVVPDVQSLRELANRFTWEASSRRVAELALDVARG